MGLGYRFSDGLKQVFLDNYLDLTTFIVKEADKGNKRLVVVEKCLVEYT